MFDMIAYVSFPYSMDHHASKNRAIVGLNKALASLYRRNPNWVYVNGLYSHYNNPHIPTETKLGISDALQLSKVLLDSAQVCIVIHAKGWEYSDIVMTEAGYFSSLNRPILYEAHDDELFKAS